MPDKLQEHANQPIDETNDDLTEKRGATPIMAQLRALRRSTVYLCLTLFGFRSLFLE